MRSRTVSLPASCCRATFSSPPIARGQLGAPPQLVELGIPGHNPTGREP